MAEPSEDPTPTEESEAAHALELAKQLEELDAEFGLAGVTSLPELRALSARLEHARQRRGADQAAMAAARKDLAGLRECVAVGLDDLRRLSA